MELIKKTIVGTVESSDCLVTLEPSKSLTIKMESVVEKQFGNQIETVIRQTLSEMNISGALVKINDKGALDCVIVARLRTAIMRSCEQTDFNWEV